MQQEYDDNLRAHTFEELVIEGGSALNPRQCEFATTRRRSSARWWPDECVPKIFETLTAKRMTEQSILRLQHKEYELICLEIMHGMYVDSSHRVSMAQLARLVYAKNQDDSTLRKRMKGEVEWLQRTGIITFEIVPGTGYFFEPTPILAYAVEATS